MLNPSQQAFTAVCAASDSAATGTSDEQLRRLLEVTSDGAWDWDIASCDCFYSPRWLSRLGYMSGQMAAYIGTLETIVHPDDYPEVMAALQAHLRGDTESYDCEYRQRTASGAWLWTHDRGRVIARDAAGEPLRMAGTSTDVSNRKRAEEELRESETHYRHFIEVNPAIFWTSDAAGNVTIASEADAQLLGSATSLDDISGFGALVHPDDREDVQNRIAASLASGQPMDFTYRFWMRGRFRWVHTQGHARRDAEGRILRWYGSSMDIDRRKTAEDALRTAQERLTLALDGNRVGVWDWNIPTDEIWLSDSVYLLQGYAPKEFEARSPGVRDIVHPDDLASLRQSMRDTLTGKMERFLSEHRVRTKQGAWIWVADRGKVVERDASGRAVRMVGTRADVNDRKIAEERIRWMAGHDSLTGLPNRRLFQNALDECLARAKATGTQVGLLLLDLDEFKQVNDTLGHDGGDGLLQTFGQRLRAASSDRHIVARLGGDEFAVILPDLSPGHDLGADMTSLDERLREPIVLGGRVLDCCASIGGSLYPEHAAEPQDLLKSADIALYMSKSRDNGRATLFTPDMGSMIQGRATMMRTAREAIDGERIVPFYQPKVSLSSSRLTGFEALLRWRDPLHGFQPPGSIAAAFEDLELATKLSERMLDKVTADMRRWLDDGVEFGHVAINASAAEFRQNDLAERVLGKLEAAGVPPRLLEIEVTETVFLGRGAGDIERTLKILSNQGVRIALDDFGTGYASLTHLKQFPVDTIKIDRSFIRDLEDDVYDAAIVRAVLSLGQNLGIDIVAEGIETPIQAAYLWAQGCAFGQGHIFGKPMPAEHLPELIANWQPSRHWRATTPGVTP